MPIKYLLKISLSSFKKKKSRTFLTILAMGVAISAILLFVSLGYGLQRMMLGQITTKEALLSLDLTTPDSNVLPLNQETISKVSKVKHVEEVSPLAILAGQITYGNLTSDGDLNICSPSYLELSSISPELGRNFQKNDEMVVSSALVKSFGSSDKDVLGKTVGINLFLNKKTERGGEKVQVVSLKNNFRVVGVIKDNSMVYLYLPISALGGIKIPQFNELKLKVGGAKFLKSVSDKLAAMGFTVSSLSETVNEINKIFRAIQVGLGSFGIVALIIAAIGMANTMMVSLLERMNEIGIMKAIGASDKDIELIFLSESMIIAFLGGLVGIVLNFIIAKFLNFGFNLLARGLGGQSVSLFYTPFWFILLILIFSVLVGAFSGFFPARRGAKTDPLEALRYK